MSSIVAATGPITSQVATPSASAGMTNGAVRAWLRLEGLAALALGLVLYGLTGGPWLLLVPLLLVPDLSAVGYLAGSRAGAVTYNLAHTWVPGIVLLGISAWLASPVVLAAAAIFIAHVGMDRAMGYGLKLPTAFQDTHLGRIGRSKP